MKRVFILLLLVLKNCDGVKIIKRFINESNNTTDNSFQINVTAGYGVHSENITTGPSPVYMFPERTIQRENVTTATVQVLQDQNSQPSQLIQEVRPTTVYKIHEKSSELQEKYFELPRNHRHRSVEQRVRYKNNKIRNSPNEELKEPVKYQKYEEPKLTAATKIVEVLRVPAMYELRLQSDPERLVALNTAWVSKLMSHNLHNQYKRPVQPFYNVGAIKQQNIIPQASTSSLSFAHPFTLNPITAQNTVQNQKPKYSTPKLGDYNQIKTSYGVSQTKPTPQGTAKLQNFAGFKNNYLTPHSYQNSYQLHKSTTLSSETLKKDIPEVSTQPPVSYQQLNAEASSEFYQKPQALHEVPAPVLNKQTHNQYFSKIKTTSSPNLVYGKPIDPPYQPATASVLWDGLQNQNHQNGILINQQQVEPVYNYYQHQEPSKTNGFESEKNVNLYTNLNQNYQGYRNVQNYYNEGIGDHLDQNLVNVNGGVAAYVNNDGTMTVSNFHHNPKLYGTSTEYEIPMNEENNLNGLSQNFNVGNLPYSPQENDFVKLNNQLYSEINRVIPVYENNFGADISSWRTQPHAGVAAGNASGASSRSGREEMSAHRYDLKNPQISKRTMYPKMYNNQRRYEPIDYILYIKERTLD